MENMISIAIYLSVFFLSAFFINLADINFSKKKYTYDQIIANTIKFKFKIINTRSILFSIIAFSIPCILAGMRSTDVGTDTHGYALIWFNKALLSNDFSSLLYYTRSSDSQVGILYVLLVYISARLSSDIGVLLFLTQLLMLVPIYYSLYLKRNKFPMWMSLIAYYLIFYNDGLNVMRQGIAIAFLFLAFSLYEQHQYKSTIIFSVIAVLFHFSMVFIMGIYLLVYLCIPKIKHLQFLVQISIVAIGLVIFTHIPSIVKFLYINSILPEKYYSSFQFISTGTGGWSLLLIFAVYLFIPQFLSMCLKRKKYYSNNIYTTFGYIELVLQMAVHICSEYIWRVAIAFSLYRIWVYLDMRNLFEKKNRYVIDIVLIALIVLLWMVQLVVFGSDTFPYRIR